MYLFAIAVFLPALASLLLAAYWMVRWFISKRGSSGTNDMLIGALGPLSVFFPGSMSKEPHRCLRRSFYAGAFFAAYCIVLTLLFKP